MSAVESHEWQDSSILSLGKAYPLQSSATGSAAVTSNAAALMEPFSRALQPKSGSHWRAECQKAVRSSNTGRVLWASQLLCYAEKVALEWKLRT